MGLVLKFQALEEVVVGVTLDIVERSVSQFVPFIRVQLTRKQFPYIISAKQCCYMEYAAFMNCSFVEYLRFVANLYLQVLSCPHLRETEYIGELQLVAFGLHGTMLLQNTYAFSLLEAKSPIQGRHAELTLLIRGSPHLEQQFHGIWLIGDGCQYQACSSEGSLAIHCLALQRFLQFAYQTQLCSCENADLLLHRQVNNLSYEALLSFKDLFVSDCCLAQDAANSFSQLLCRSFSVPPLHQKLDLFQFAEAEVSLRPH